MVLGAVGFRVIGFKGCYHMSNLQGKIYRDYTGHRDIISQNGE